MLFPFEDKDNFKAIFIRYYSALVNFAHSKFGIDIAVSKNLVLHIFKSIWERRSNIEKIESVSTFLFRSVKNSAIAYKVSGVMNYGELTELVKNYDYSEDQFLSDVQSILIKSHILSELKLMTKQMREIFELNKIKGLSYNEIAEQLNISERTVESNIVRAFAILRKGLNEVEFLKE